MQATSICIIEHRFAHRMCKTRGGQAQKDMKSCVLQKGSRARKGGAERVPVRTSRPWTPSRRCASSGSWTGLAPAALRCRTSEPRRREGFSPQARRLEAFHRLGKCLQQRDGSQQGGLRSGRPRWRDLPQGGASASVCFEIGARWQPLSRHPRRTLVWSASQTKFTRITAQTTTLARVSARSLSLETGAPAPGALNCQRRS